MVATVKNDKVRLILTIVDIFFVFEKIQKGTVFGIFRGGQKSRGPHEISIEMPHYVFHPQKSHFQN
jgi:hypothetical protein